MKTINLTITALVFALVSNVSHSAKALDIAIEMEKFKAEYYSTTDKGIITVTGCSQCKGVDTYTFKGDVKILKKGKPINLDVFIKDYWNAEYPTIFLDPKTKLIKLIAY